MAYGKSMMKKMGRKGMMKAMGAKSKKSMKPAFPPK
tara:strand:- start:611 stop:718 length:108 start_codon:yes stop_codon:yes gene_type:complete